MGILEWIQNIDAQILLFIQQYIRQDMMNWFWKGITFLGDGGWFWIVLGVVLLIPKKTRKSGFTALLALIIGSVITNLVLKTAVARIRPYDGGAGSLGEETERLLLSLRPHLCFFFLRSCIL